MSFSNKTSGPSKGKETRLKNSTKRLEFSSFPPFYSLPSPAETAHFAEIQRRLGRQNGGRIPGKGIRKQ